MPKSRLIRTTTTVALLLLGYAAAGGAVEVPEAVSPGSTAKLSPIESACPTFSWGTVPGAGSYQLVVYRAGREGEESGPVLEQELAGSASSWTPSLDRCLKRGGRYAWSVRAAGEDSASDWSPPLLFQVVAGSTAEELEQALAVVRRHLEGRSHDQDAAEPAAPPSPEEPRGVSSESGGRTAPAATQLSVEGNLDATSFTGDGSSLGGVATDVELAAHAAAAGAHHEPTVDTTCNGAACDGAGFTNLNASNLSAGTVAEPRIDPALTRDGELAGALEVLDCPPGHFLSRVDAGAPACLTPFLEMVTEAGGGNAADIPEGPATQGPATPYPSPLTVSSFSGTLVDVNVTLEGLSHTYPQDLAALLVAPDGKAVLLMRDVGGGSPGVSAIELTFDDQAEETIDALTNPGSGSYRPSGVAAGDLPPPAPPGPYVTTLAHFAGIDPVGEWQLYLFDDAGGDVGNVGSWRLALTDGSEGTGPLPIARGGTGATDAVQARDQLGAAAAQDLANHAAQIAAHHLPYTNLDAVAAMGAEANGNPLNHDRYTDAEALAALAGTCIGRRWLDQGDGTVLDCNTRLVWLKDASCEALGPSGGGFGTYFEALAAANALADGTCGLTDGSPPGSWSLPDWTDLCSSLAIDTTCFQWDFVTSLADTRWSGSPKLGNARGDARWTEGDAFVGVQSFYYWSTFAPGGIGDRVAVNLASGWIEARNPNSGGYIWPVRDTR